MLDRVIGNINDIRLQGLWLVWTARQVADLFFVSWAPLESTFTVYNLLEANLEEIDSH